MLLWHPRFSAGLPWWCWPAAFAARPLCSDCQVEKGRLPRRQASQALAISLEELGISRRVLTNPLVVAVSPRLQRLLDDSCALDSTKEAEALRLAENEL